MMENGEKLAIHRSRFIELSPANITALAFSHKSGDGTKLTPSELRVAVGRADGNIEIWNPRNNWVQEIVIQGGKDRSIEGLCWANSETDPLRLFSIGGSTIVTEWDLSTGLPLKNYDCNGGVIWSIAINDAQDKLALGCDNGTVVIVDISGGVGSLEHESILMRQECRILALTWNKSNYVIGGCSDGRIRVWSVQKTDETNGRLINTMKVDKSKVESTLVWSVLYLPKTNQIVSGDSTGCVKYWNFQYSTLNQSFNVHQADVLCLASDYHNETVFSAGVDRKIYQFTRSTAKQQTKQFDNTKWVVSSNRLLQSNDVRAMAVYQSKGADFLVSGGVEKTLVISSVTSFAEGNYRKIPTSASVHSNILINEQQRLIVMWQGSNIKIWHLGDNLSSDKNYKLVCKLTLKDEQNISTCAMSPDGTVLLVGRPSSAKIFHLQPVGSKLKVTKLENDMLLKVGVRVATFIDNSKVLINSIDDELFSVDLEAENDEDKDELELPDLSQSRSIYKLPYIAKLNSIKTHNDSAVLSYHDGTVVYLNLDTKNSSILARLNSYITTILINSERSSVVVVTAENKIYEFNLKDKIVDNSVDSEDNILTKWSKDNTDNIPKQLLESRGKCFGAIQSPGDGSKIWFWSNEWIARVDFNQNFLQTTRKKNKKRSRDGLTITDDSNFLNTRDEDEEENDLESNEVLQIISSQTKLKNSEITKSKSESDAFYFNDKYKFIMHTGMLSADELIIVERPQAMTEKEQGAFRQPKLII